MNDQTSHYKKEKKEKRKKQATQQNRNIDMKKRNPVPHYTSQ